MSVSACIVHSKHRKQHTVAAISDALPRRRPTIIIVGCLVVEKCVQQRTTGGGCGRPAERDHDWIETDERGSCDRNDDRNDP